MEPLITWPVAFLAAAAIGAWTWRRRQLDYLEHDKASFDRRVALQKEIEAEQRTRNEAGAA